VAPVAASWDAGCKIPVLIASVSVPRAAAAPWEGDGSGPQRFCCYALASLLQLRWSLRRLRRIASAANGNRHALASLLQLRCSHQRLRRVAYAAAYTHHASASSLQLRCSHPRLRRIASAAAYTRKAAEARPGRRPDSIASGDGSGRSDSAHAGLYQIIPQRPKRGRKPLLIAPRLIVRSPLAQGSHENMRLLR
jgi:hypothetical protein